MNVPVLRWGGWQAASPAACARSRVAAPTPSLPRPVIQAAGLLGSKQDIVTCAMQAAGKCSCTKCAGNCGAHVCHPVLGPTVHKTTILPGASLNASSAAMHHRCMRAYNRHALVAAVI